MDKIEKDLIDVTAGKLDDLQKEIEDHEKYLNKFLQSNHYNETSYRDKHQDLVHKIENFEEKFRTIKQEVFALAAEVDKSK